MFPRNYFSTTFFPALFYPQASGESSAPQSAPIEADYLLRLHTTANNAAVAYHWYRDVATIAFDTTTEPEVMIPLVTGLAVFRVRIEIADGSVGDFSDPIVLNLIGQPDETPVCSVYLDLTPVPSVPIIGYLRLTVLPKNISRSWIVGQQIIAESDSYGRILFPPVPQGASALVIVPEAGLNQLCTIPSASTFRV